MAPWQGAFFPQPLQNTVEVYTMITRAMHTESAVRTWQYFHQAKLHRHSPLRTAKHILQDAQLQAPREIAKLLRPGQGQQAPHIARIRNAIRNPEPAAIARWYHEETNDYGSRDERGRSSGLVHIWNQQRGSKHRHTGFITYSPFGTHAAELLAAWQFMQGGGEAMRVACYGSGFHSDAHQITLDLLLAYGDAVPTEHAQFRDATRRAAQQCFGELMGCSYEPREILALMQIGRGLSELTVFDRSTAVAEDLAMPHSFSWFDSYTVSAVPNYRDRQAYREYWNILSIDRDVTSHSLANDTQARLNWKTFALTDHERQVLRPIRTDFVIDPLPAAPESFDLSVHLNTSSFLTRGAMFLHYAEVVDRMRFGGIWLTDALVTPAILVDFGLEHVADSHIPSAHSEGGICSQLYQRARPSAYVDELVAVKREASTSP